MDDNKKMMNMMEKMLKMMGDICSRMDSMENRMDSIENRMDSIENRMDSMENRMDNFEKTEKAHFEHTCNEFERIEKKIDSNFKNLDKKIDITKEKIIIEVIEGVEEVSATTSKFISKVENKVETEVKERKYQIERLNNLTDYDKIVLKNLESRVAILEEESQKYNGK